MSYFEGVLKILNFWRDFFGFFGFEFGNLGNGLFYFFGIGGTNPARRSVPKSPSGGMHYCFNATGGCTAKNKPGITPGRSHLLYLHAKYIVNIIINNNVMPLHPFGLCFAMGLLYRAMPWRWSGALRVALYRYVKFFSYRVRGVIGFACCVTPSKRGEILRVDIAVTPIRLPENLPFAAFFRVRNGVDRRASGADACILAIT